MVSFTAVLQQFGDHGDKTGWVYLLVPADAAQQLAPGNRKTFRVRGLLDTYPVKAVAVMPMGDGQFILPVNSKFRKALHKSTGDKVKVQLEKDEQELEMPEELVVCLADEPEAARIFSALPKSHKHYYIRWVGSAKTAPTKAKRIVAMLESLLAGKTFSQMIRDLKEKNDL